MCARFGEFWLFFTEQDFTLPLLCYEKSNQGTQEFAHKSAKRAHPLVCGLCVSSRYIFGIIPRKTKSDLNEVLEVDSSMGSNCYLEMYQRLPQWAIVIT